MQWFYSKGDTQMGHVSQDELRAKIFSGEVGQGEKVWKAGMAGWVPLATVPDLIGGGKFLSIRSSSHFHGLAASCAHQWACHCQSGMWHLGIPVPAGLNCGSDLWSLGIVWDFQIAGTTDWPWHGYCGFDLQLSEGCRFSAWYCHCHHFRNFQVPLNDLTLSFVMATICSRSIQP